MSARSTYESESGGRGKGEIFLASMSNPVEDTDPPRDPQPSEYGETQEIKGSSSSPAIAGKESVAVDAEEVSRRKGERLEAESTRSNGITVAVAGQKNGGEKKVGALLATAMKKFAVPRSSSYRGVTKLKWSGKFEAHVWDSTSQVEGRKRKGKHVYLGSYNSEEKAARAHDLAALKYWGPSPSTKLNFPVSDYEQDLETMKNMSQEEYVAHVRRQSSCFSRGASVYRGVTRRKDGKWQARIGRVGESRDVKDIYLGTFVTEPQCLEAEALALFNATLVDSCTLPAPVINFDEDALITSLITDKNVAGYGRKLKKLSKKKTKKIVPKNSADEVFSDEESFLEALMNPAFSPGDIERRFGRVAAGIDHDIT